MDARSIIAKLRRAQVPTSGELTWFAQGLADGSVSDAQAGAFAMAVCMGGLGAQGRADLTVAMRDSGDVLSWDFDGPVIDKHSTGGVGDSVSLVLAPALAELGAYVPMISGRGLGHTGGTLDKLEAIPGVSTQIGQDRLTQILRDTGAAIVGATGQIAPADKRLYAIRDVTATVESLDLITASILSKKLAASPQALVLDVKVGSGAFMKTLEDARKLAQALTETANAAGCRTSAVITDMHQPLAPALGNALEVAEVMNVLTNAPYAPLAEISTELGGVLLADAGMFATADEGRDKVMDVIRDGRAAERFGRMMAAVGGPLQFVDNWSRYLPEASVILEVPAPDEGYITAIDGEALGLAVVALGGGRQVEDDVIDPAVGLSGIVRLGDKVDKGTPLAVVHAAREDAARQAADTVLRAITIGADTTNPSTLVHERIRP
ncbi:Thymidine phosphorylase [Ruegeria denitrificans]|uniref:Thymidine phosphorylase n=1 Tax=Ruegeria denitrificans TaxID=1715692 RepID=A0A0P1ID03_9RHOB|nr:thymidine phosphorylase [Ruegeria denitrificans]CUK05897.1 Thymidine phosphorylase [Ruegeria denitrificans]